MGKKLLKRDQDQGRPASRCPSVPLTHLLLAKQAEITKYHSIARQMRRVMLFLGIAKLLEIPRMRNTLSSEGEPENDEYCHVARAIVTLVDAFS